MSAATTLERASDLGTVFARIVLDGDKPVATIDEDGRKEYWIDLCFQPKPGVPVESVTFVLDEEKFYDYLRLAEPRDNFKARIRSYDDFAVTAKIELENRFPARSEILTELLRRGHRSDVPSNPAVAEAIEELRTHQA
jgi:hypothetical protein